MLNFHKFCCQIADARCYSGHAPHSNKMHKLVFGSRQLTIRPEGLWKQAASHERRSVEVEQQGQFSKRPQSKESPAPVQGVLTSKRYLGGEKQRFPNALAAIWPVGQMFAKAQTTGTLGPNRPRYRPTPPFGLPESGSPKPAAANQAQPGRAANKQRQRGRLRHGLEP